MSKEWYQNKVVNQIKETASKAFKDHEITNVCSVHFNDGRNLINVYHLKSLETTTYSFWVSFAPSHIHIWGDVCHDGVSLNPTNPESLQWMLTTTDISYIIGKISRECVRSEFDGELVEEQVKDLIKNANANFEDPEKTKEELEEYLKGSYFNDSNDFLSSCVQVKSIYLQEWIAPYMYSADAIWAYYCLMKWRELYNKKLG